MTGECPILRGEYLEERALCRDTSYGCCGAVMLMIGSEVLSLNLYVRMGIHMAKRARCYGIVGNDSDSVCKLAIAGTMA